MTVSVLTEKNLRQLGQWNGMVLCVQRRARSPWQCGQRTPAGQRPSIATPADDRRAMLLRAAKLQGRRLAGAGVLRP